LIQQFALAPWVDPNGAKNFSAGFTLMEILPSNWGGQELAEIAAAWFGRSV